MKIEKRSNVQFHIRINSDLLRRFRKECYVERRALNAQMEIILEDWLKKRKEGTTQQLQGKHVVIDKVIRSSTPYPNPAQDQKEVRPKKLSGGYL